MLNLILNVIWLLAAGVWLAFAYAISAVALFLTIIGIPFGIQCLKLAGFALWPFGRMVVDNATSSPGWAGVGNVLWLIFVGWWLALAHVLVGVILCVTIIGIPLGLGVFKMIGLALWPFGRTVVDIDPTVPLPADAYTVTSVKALPPG